MSSNLLSRYSFELGFIALVAGNEAVSEENYLDSETVRRSGGFQGGHVQIVESAAHSEKWLCPYYCRQLLLEEVLEGLAGVVVARRGSRGGRGVAFLRVGGRGGVFLDGGAEFVESAVVLSVLGREALGNGLGAL